MHNPYCPFSEPWSTHLQDGRRLRLAAHEDDSKIIRRLLRHQDVIHASSAASSYSDRYSKV